MGIIHLLVANGTFGLSCYLLCICNLCICICAFVLVHLYLCICICVSVLVYLYLANRTLGLSRSPLILLEGFVVSNCLLTRVNQILNQSEPNHPLTRMVTVEKGEMYINKVCKQHQIQW